MLITSPRTAHLISFHFCYFSHVSPLFLTVLRLSPLAGPRPFCFHLQQQLSLLSLMAIWVLSPSTEVLIFVLRPLFKAPQLFVFFLSELPTRRRLVKDGS